MTVKMRHPPRGEGFEFGGQKRRKSAMGMVMQSKQSAEKHLPLEKRRRYEYFATELPGRLCSPAEGGMIECRVLNLCSSGARVSCKMPPLLQSYVVLRVDGFGSFECVGSRYVKGNLDVRFVCKEARRRRLLADIQNFLDERVRLRRFQNMPSISEVRFTRPNGEQFRCGIVEASSQRLLLRTPIQPPVGEIIHVGQTYGRVALHCREGIAMHFLRTEPDTEVPRHSV